MRKTKTKTWMTSWALAILFNWCVAVWNLVLIFRHHHVWLWLIPFHAAAVVLCGWCAFVGTKQWLRSFAIQRDPMLRYKQALAQRFARHLWN